MLSRQQGTGELVYLEPAGCSSLLSCSRGLAVVALLDQWPACSSPQLLASSASVAAGAVHYLQHRNHRLAVFCLQNPGNQADDTQVHCK